MGSLKDLLHVDTRGQWDLRRVDGFIRHDLKIDIDVLETRKGLFFQLHFGDGIRMSSLWIHIYIVGGRLLFQKLKTSKGNVRSASRLLLVCSLLWSQQQTGACAEN